MGVAADVPTAGVSKMRTSRIKRTLIRVMLAAPALLILLFFVAALFALFVASFQEFDPGGRFKEPSSITLANYAKALTDPLYIGTLVVTIRIAAITALISLILGLPMAFWIVRTDSAILRSGLILLVTVAFLTNVIVRLYALVQVLANTGLVNRLLQTWELIRVNDFVPLMRNEFGVIIGTTSFATPFVIFMLAGTFRRVDRTLEEAAQSLGADEITTFFRITVPLIMPGIVSALLLAFVLSSVTFASPLILGGGAVNMISNRIYDQAMIVFNMEFSAALAVIALVATLIVLYIAGRLERRERRVSLA